MDKIWIDILGSEWFIPNPFHSIFIDREARTITEIGRDIKGISAAYICQSLMGILYLTPKPTSRPWVVRPKKAQKLYMCIFIFQPTSFLQRTNQVVFFAKKNRVIISPSIEWGQREQRFSSSIGYAEINSNSGFSNCCWGRCFNFQKVFEGSDEWLVYSKEDS